MIKSIEAKEPSMINRRHRRPSSRHGFTLFEIAISLVIMTFGVVTVMLIIPVGIKVQQTSRMSLLASAKAMELIESFTSRIGGERIAEFETPEPWDTRPFCYSSTRWDFECRTSRFDSGIIPLPLDIAKRLDSDGDEIQTLLASGAYLYYADPKLLPGIDSRYVNKEAPNEAQKMIFAVIGYAQNNAIPVLPWKAWPYRAAYPSPPLYVGLNPGRHMAPELGPTTWSSESASTNPGSDWHSLEGWCNGNPDPSVPRDRDPLMNGVFQAVAKYFWTLKGTDLSFDERTTTANPTIQPVRDVLVKAVIDFCKDKFDNIIAAPSEYTTYYSPPDTTPNYQALAKQYEADFRVKCRAAEQLAGASYDPVKATQRAQLALRVQCMRFMAFLTSTFYLKRQGDAAEPNLSLFKVDNQSLSHDRLRYFQDCCKSSAMLYAASFPYDWGAPRPVSRCIMMDHPLIEFDLFASRSGPIAGTGVMAEMWKPISAQTITSIGLPGIFPGVLTYSAGVTSWDNTKSPFTRDTRAAGHPFWGDANHFTLTRPFQAAERCRQLVFWSVDWQSYEDAETAPGAPLDASRVPCLGMSKNNMNNYNGRLNWGPGAFDGYFLRNPERNLQFIRDMSTVTTGTVLARNQIVGSNGGGDGAIRVLLGIYGADRNHNYILDRGPLPKSVRQRAQTIARFQFYDPRIPVSLR